jgi:hypothetical protein
MAWSVALHVAKCLCAAAGNDDLVVTGRTLGSWDTSRAISGVVGEIEGDSISFVEPVDGEVATILKTVEGAIETLVAQIEGNIVTTVHAAS